MTAEVVRIDGTPDLGAEFRAAIANLTADEKLHSYADMLGVLSVELAHMNGGISAWRFAVAETVRTVSAR